MLTSRDAVAISDSIRPLLAGKPSALQGAVLADLLAIWLAGHHVPGDESATRTMRDDLLARHCEAVRSLIRANANLLGTTP